MRFILRNLVTFGTNTLNIFYAKGKGSLTTGNDKENRRFRAKALRRELIVGVGENHACFIRSKRRFFPLSFQVVREPLPFAYH